MSYLSDFSIFGDELKDYHDLFLKHNIRDCGDLFCAYYIGRENDYIKTETIRSFLDNVIGTKNMLAKLDKDLFKFGKQIDQMPQFVTYNQSSYDMKLLSSIDEYNSLDVLPIHRPLVNKKQEWLNSLHKRTVSGLKYIMTHLASNGQLSIARNHNFDEKHFNVLCDIINFYDDHVIRLIKEAQVEDESITERIFYSHFKFKYDTVFRNRVKIFDCLFANGGNLIFKDFTPSQIVGLINGIGRGPQKAANQMATIIALYSTKKELIWNPTNPPVIKRLQKHNNS